MHMQMVELLYSEKNQCDFREVANRINQIADTGATSGPEPMTNGQMHFFHEKLTWDCKDGSIPCQTAFMPTDKSPGESDYLELIQQSWGCPTANDIVNSANHVCLVTEFMAQGLNPQDRIKAFHATLQAVTEITKPVAMAFHHSCQIIDPSDYLSNLDRPFWARIGVTNVRFFNISNGGSDEMIMDTRGLSEIGIPDLQCHFQGLDTNGVAGNLSSIAMYVAEHGPVIESGHTVPGLNEGDLWVCQLEDSLLDPKREVLDVNPGPPHAAGNRH